MQPMPSTDLIPYSAASEMADTFHASTQAMREAMETIKRESGKLHDLFKMERYSNPFGVGFSYCGRRGSGTRTPDEIFNEMKYVVWQYFAHRIGIKNIMSVKRATEFERQMNEGELPEVTGDNIINVILSMTSHANDYAKEAAQEALAMLCPHRGEYKTNNAFRVGRKVILTWYVEQGYGRGNFRVNYNREKNLIALDAVFHLLDGKGPMKQARGELVSAINDSQGGRGESTYFKFKCFKNHNLHLEMKRLDLVKELNGLSTGEYVLGEDQQ